MSKNFLKSLVGFAFVVVFAVGSYGCQKAEVVASNDKPVVQAEAKVEVPAVVAKADSAQADWHLYTDTVRGFSISYPLAKDSGVNAELGVTLPEAIGGKERVLKIESHMPAKVELDTEGCMKLGEQSPSMKGKQKIHGVNFCLIAFDEGAMGSTYRTYHYTTKLTQVIDVTMRIRFPTSVRIYGGCESDPDQTSQKCQELAFDEIRDTKLFADVINTFKVL
ncbi:MAG: hypothetical protein NTZ25_06120 [Candidatus Peregrinibacteria bacterium]|nr:hypothetical protein [Candidatus Peregrinibacteria bacterium]